MTASGDVTQPIQWSSEVWDDELGLVYYNWRYYVFNHGRFHKRDDIETGDYNKYKLCLNSPIVSYDSLGRLRFSFSYTNNFKINFEEPHFSYNDAAVYVLPSYLYSRYVLSISSIFSYDAHIIYNNDSNLKDELHYAISEAIDKIRNNQLELARDIYVSHDGVMETKNNTIKSIKRQLGD